MRNLAARILVAVLGIPVLIYAAIHGEWLLRGLVIVLQLFILWEWWRLTQLRYARVPLAGVVTAAAGIDIAVFTGGQSPYLALAFVGLGFLLLFEVFRRRHEPIESLGSAALFLIYIILPLSLWPVFSATGAAARFAPMGALAALFVATWLCDTGAYFIGRAIGRHKLYPAASPNKTIEGFFGGIFAAAISLPLFRLLNWATPNQLDLIALPLIVGIIGQVGDLLESLMKREVRIKDTSAILPGHGGFLDRFDSLLLATPFFFAYLLLSA